jgi:hypothetical protein
VITEGDVYYLAALIDGEGCISVRLRKRGHNYARVRVGMRDPEAVIWAYRKFGGTYHLDKKGTHFWTMNGVIAVSLLEVISPYLKLERRQKSAKRAIRMNARKSRV